MIDITNLIISHYRQDGIVKSNIFINTYFTEESFRELLSQIPGLQTEKLWITGDVREGRRDERWLNVILRRR